MESSQYYRTLTRNMVLTVILISLTPLMLVSAIIGYSFETSYREKVVAHLVELVEKHQQNIDIFLHEKLSYVRVLADSFSFEQLSNDAVLRHKLATLQSAYGGIFVDIGLVDERGMQIAYAGLFKLDKADYSTADWFKQAIEKPYYISDVFLGLRKQPHFIVTAKHRWEDQNYILRATIEFEAFNSLVENIQVGKTGSAFIINREGQFQTQPHRKPILDQDFFVKLMKENRRNEASPYGTVAEMLKTQTEKPNDGKTDSGLTVGRTHYGDSDVIYVMTPLKSGEWILAYQQDETDAFSDLYQTRMMAILISLLGGIAIVATAFILSKRMVRRIYKADQDKEMMNEQVIEAGKLASVGELAAGIAHEINNPVAIMVEEAGWASDLLEEEELKECKNLDEYRRALQQIRTQGSRCKDITFKLLSFARRTDPRTRMMQVNELVEEIVSISEQRSRFGNVKLTQHLQSDLPEICASPSEIQQVVLNLINNAIDAIGPEGGAVDITTRLDGDKVIVDVADTGHGIPKAVMARIFDPFFTTKPVGKGTGLGLSICYGIVKKMGGDITLNSAVGVGTVFHVHLPLPSKNQDKKPIRKKSISPEPPDIEGGSEDEMDENMITNR
jgi:two-component system, NtrC family, sensor kinase